MGIELETDTYPGFATDWQQPTVVTLTQAKGISVVHETVYEDRFEDEDGLPLWNRLQKILTEVRNA